MHPKPPPRWTRLLIKSSETCTPAPHTGARSTIFIVYVIQHIRTSRNFVIQFPRTLWQKSLMIVSSRCPLIPMFIRMKVWISQRKSLICFLTIRVLHPVDWVHNPRTLRRRRVLYRLIRCMTFRLCVTTTLPRTQPLTTHVSSNERSQIEMHLFVIVKNRKLVLCSWKMNWMLQSVHTSVRG